MITKDMTMCQAVLNYHQLLPLLPRFNIKTGFEERTVEEVCAAFHVNTDFFLEIANTYVDIDYIPQIDILHFSLGMVIDYLRNTHSYYLEHALPRIEKQIRTLLQDNALSGKERNLVSDFFNDYKKEFLEHIMKEEEEILPYMLEIESQSAKEKPDAAFLDKLERYSINEFAREHDRLENSLENLSKLIIKYLPPFEDYDLCNQVLIDLSTLVKDLIDHAAMEDRVLVPRVAELELTLKNRKDRN